MARASNMATVAVTIASGLLAAAAPCAHAAAAGNQGIDAGHSGYVASGPDAPLITRWSRSDFHAGGTWPVTDLGSVFVQTVRGSTARLTSLDGSTGATRWDVPGAGGEIATVGGRVFAWTPPQYSLGSRDVLTGTTQWADNSSLFGGPVADGALVVASGVRGVRAFDPATGALRWEAGDGAGEVALDADRVYALTGGKNACVVRAYPREPLLGLALQEWSAPCGATTYGSQPLVVAAGRVFAQQVVLDAATGRKLYDLPAHIGLAVAPDGSAYVVRDGEITAHAPGGAQRWRTEIAGQASSSPILAGTSLYAMTLDGVLRALDAASGAVLSSTPTRLRGFVGTTMTDDDTLLLAGEQGVLALTTGIIRSARAFGVRLRPNHAAPATARIALQRPATVRTTVRRGRREVARSTARLAAGHHTVAALIARSRARALLRASVRSLSISITARDEAGTTQRVTKSAPVRR